MFPSKQHRPRLRVGLSRPISIPPKRMPPGALNIPRPPPPAQRPLSNVSRVSLLPVNRPPPANSPQPTATRLPLHPVQPHRPQPSSSSFASRRPSPSEADCKLYFKVLYTKRSKKKHKSWLDGYFIVTNDRHVQLLDENGKKIGGDRFSKAIGGVKVGNIFEVNSWQLEVQSSISEEDFVSGRVFAPPPPSKLAAVRPKQRPFKPLRASSSFGSLHSTVDRSPIPFHDPNAPNAVVLLPKSKQLETKNIPVVLDPFLAKRMRPHQIDGIKFLFECTAARVIRGEDGWEGAILADEMGLGKSLQAIALIWTMVKQGPLGKPLAKKAMIVCPASLVRNWVNEVKKWLGDERLAPIAVESGASAYDGKAAISHYVMRDTPKSKLLIVSYEMFRSNAKDLYQAGCGLLICDEGHRLKSAAGNKTVDALRGLRCKKRVILTGTPVQNDLEEFFAVCDFVNPGCLNDLNKFRSVFANPIIASRDTNAPMHAKFLGEERAKELSRITSKFVLRRTSDILEKYLPPKHETAIFCRLQPLQANVYQREAIRRYRHLREKDAMSIALQSINVLRKVCIHPSLIPKSKSNYGEDDVNSDGEDEGFTEDEQDEDTKDCHLDYTEDNCHNSKDNEKGIDINESTKLQVAATICQRCVEKKDRVIIVSNFTTALDVMETMLTQMQINFCRLDGKTPVNQRGDIVRRFNEGSLGDVFLLSARAGGVGLNLIGANRLILFDPDWNPATDVQAMARVWRDGQKKHVFVYRLLCTGTIEEKIFQRQLFKGELQDAVEDSSKDTNEVIGGRPGKDGNFKADELKDVFTYNGEVPFCETLDVLERSKEDMHKAGLLEEFQAYKLVAEKENVINAVWCEDDAVLDQALNGDIHTHGLVSYLYKKSFGARLDDDDAGKTAQLNYSTPVVVKREKRKLTRLLSDSEDESDEEPCVSAAERIFNSVSKSSTATSKRFRANTVGETVDLTLDNDGEEVTTCAPVLKNERASSSCKQEEGSRQEKTGGSVDKESAVGGEVLDLTWDDALNWMEDDV